MTSIVVAWAKHAGRNIRHGGLPFFFATAMTALGLFSLAAFLSMLASFETVSSTVTTRVGAVCFLSDKIDTAAAAEEVRALIALTPGVDETKLVTPEEALVRARRGLGETAKLLEGTAGVRLPWIIEAMPAVDVDRVALMATLGKIAGVDEVMHPGGEVKRVEALLRLLRGSGTFLGILIALVVVLVVSNAVKLTVLARKDEIAIMKLVGATDLFVRVPFLLTGLAIGVLGAVLAVVTLALAHEALDSVVSVALSGAIGTFHLAALPSSWFWLVIAGGAVLGVLGAAASVGRFLRV